MLKEKCLECGHLLVGRTDKKFCCGECRYAYHNKSKIESERPIMVTNKVLRANRTILRKLCPSGKGVVNKDVLDALGFDPSCFSTIHVTASKSVYYICYDYAYTPIIQSGVKKAVIVTRQHYMNFSDPWKYVREKTD